MKFDREIINKTMDKQDLERTDALEIINEINDLITLLKKRTQEENAILS